MPSVEGSPQDRGLAEKEWCSITATVALTDTSMTIWAQLSTIIIVDFWENKNKKKIPTNQQQETDSVRVYIWLPAENSKLHSSIDLYEQWVK